MMKELIKRLNDLQLHQTYGEWQADIPEDIWEEYFKSKCKYIAYNIDVSTHRWYETSITVMEIDGELIGVRNISNLFSESMGYDDCYHHLEFFLMKEVKVTSYEVIN